MNGALESIKASGSVETLLELEELGRQLRYEWRKFCCKRVWNYTAAALLFIAVYFNLATGFFVSTV
jgi:hypothetical protein